jgi:hypothetical protein
MQKFTVIESVPMKDEQIVEPIEETEIGMKIYPEGTIIKLTICEKEATAKKKQSSSK